MAINTLNNHLQKALESNCITQEIVQKFSPSQDLNQFLSGKSPATMCFQAQCIDHTGNMALEQGMTDDIPHGNQIIAQCQAPWDFPGNIKTLTLHCWLIDPDTTEVADRKG